MLKITQKGDEIYQMPSYKTGKKDIRQPSVLPKGMEEIRRRTLNSPRKSMPFVLPISFRKLVSKCVLVMSNAGRVGKEMETSRDRTKAMKRQITPGARKTARDGMMKTMRKVLYCYVSYG